MTRPYLVLVNGVLAKRRLTFKMALSDVKELRAKGYKAVSIAEDLTTDKGDN